MRKKIRKYLRLISLHWQSSLEYKGEMFLWAFMDATPLLAMMLIWASVYRVGGEVGGFNFEYLVTYYVIGHLISSLVVVHYEIEWVDEINKGNMSKYFLMPFSTRRYAFISEVGWKLMSFLLVTVPVTTLLVVFLNNYIFIPNLLSLVHVVLLAFLGYLLDNMLTLIIIAGGFFVEQARALSHFKWMVGGIFSGSLLPLSLYPDWLENLARMLPFQYTFAAPLEQYLNQGGDINLLSLYAKGIVWLGFLYFVVRWVWNRAAKKYTAVGG